MYKWQQRRFQRSLDVVSSRTVQRLVGQGLWTRRIAELLGVTRHTAGTSVKQGMAKLGARTSTEAAVRVASPAEPIATGP